MWFICVLIAGKTGKNERKNHHIGGDMSFKKIPINKSSYIRLYDDDTFEVHCSAQGPLGANVYHFKRGLLSGSRGEVIVFYLKNIKQLMSNSCNQNTTLSNTQK